MLLPLIGVIVLAKVPAWDAAPAGGKLLVIDDKFLTVSAFDASTGKRAWKSKVIKEAMGRHTLHVNGAEVLAWFGQTLSALDPATGKVRALGQRGYNGIKWEDGGCWLDLVEGAAAQRCQCNFQVFDPVTNKDEGPRYESTYIEYFESDANGLPGRSAGCWGGSGDLLGKAGNIALISAEDSGNGKSKGKMHGPTVTAGIDLTNGTEAWRLMQASQFGGHSPDGKTCWFYGFTEELLAVDCASGTKLWSGKPLPSMGRHVAIHVAATKRAKSAVLDVRAPDKAAGVAVLYDERTGATRWSTKLAPGSIAWIRGTTPPLATSIDETSIAILDPDTGKALANVAVPTDSGVVLDGRGGFVISTKTHVIAYDENGKERARARIGGAAVTIGDGLLVANTDSELVILDRKTLAERGRVTGKFTVVHVEGGLGANHVAAFTYDGKAIGAVTLYAVQ